MFEQHHLDKVKVHESGAVEMKCEECGRHFVMQMEPYKRIVLVKGNEQVSHCGGILSGMTPRNTDNTADESDIENNIKAPNNSLLH